MGLALAPGSNFLSDSLARDLRRPLLDLSLAYTEQNIGIPTEIKSPPFQGDVTV